MLIQLAQDPYVAPPEHHQVPFEVDPLALLALLAPLAPLALSLEVLPLVFELPSVPAAGTSGQMQCNS